MLKLKYAWGIFLKWSIVVRFSWFVFKPLIFSPKIDSQCVFLHYWVGSSFCCNSLSPQSLIFTSYVTSDESLDHFLPGFEAKLRSAVDSSWRYLKTRLPTVGGYSTLGCISRSPAISFVEFSQFLSQQKLGSHRWEDTELCGCISGTPATSFF